MVKIYKKKKIERSVCTGFICDVCKKEFVNDTSVEITTFHNSWGGDSQDSIENYDVCSLKCLISGIKEGKFELNEDYDDAEFQITGDFNIKELLKVRNKND